MTGSKIVEIAKKFDDKKGAFFCKAFGLNFTCEWCVIYAWYVFKVAKACELFYDCGKVASVGLLDSWLRKKATYIKNIKDAKAGDLVICTWSGTGNNKRIGSREHLEIVIDADGNTLKTIGGNTGSNDCRKSGVNYRTRTAEYIYGIYRPAYEAEKKTKNKTEKKDKTEADIDKMAREVLKGKYGNGAERKKALGKLYNKVQKRVNELLSEKEN